MLTPKAKRPERDAFDFPGFRSSLFIASVTGLQALLVLLKVPTISLMAGSSIYLTTVSPSPARVIYLHIRGGL
jgi:hypothetical protein